MTKSTTAMIMRREDETSTPLPKRAKTMFWGTYPTVEPSMKGRAGMLVTPARMFVTTLLPSGKKRIVRAILK
ncbi:hypothetical protein ADUPG1_001950, partial [Aduncisulcus paluster]